MPCPCFIIYVVKSSANFSSWFFLICAEEYVGIFRTFSMPVYIIFFAAAQLQVKSKANLVEKIFETIIFKQLLRNKADYNSCNTKVAQNPSTDTPPPVPFAKIDRAVHRFHTFLYQPVFGYVK